MCFITHYCSCTLVYNATVCSVFCCVSFSETPRISLLFNARKLETQCIVFQCTSLCFTLHCTMQLQSIALCSSEQFNQWWDLFIALYITLSPAARLNTHLYPQKWFRVSFLFFLSGWFFSRMWGCSWLSYSTYLYLDFHLLSRRWLLHTGGSKMFEPLFHAGLSVFDQFFLQNIHVIGINES